MMGSCFLFYLVLIHRNTNDISSTALQNSKLQTASNYDKSGNCRKIPGTAETPRNTNVLHFYLLFFMKSHSASNAQRFTFDSTQKERQQQQQSMRFEYSTPTLRRQPSPLIYSKAVTRGHESIGMAVDTAHEQHNDNKDQHNKKGNNNGDYFPSRRECKIYDEIDCPSERCRQDDSTISSNYSLDIHLLHVTNTIAIEEHHRLDDYNNDEQPYYNFSQFPSRQEYGIHNILDDDIQYSASGTFPKVIEMKKRIENASTSKHDENEIHYEEDKDSLRLKSMKFKVMNRGIDDEIDALKNRIVLLESSLCGSTFHDYNKKKDYSPLSIGNAIQSRSIQPHNLAKKLHFGNAIEGNSKNTYETPEDRQSHLSSSSKEVKERSALPFKPITALRRVDNRIKKGEKTPLGRKQRDHVGSFGITPTPAKTEVGKFVNMMLSPQLKKAV